MWYKIIDDDDEQVAVDWYKKITPDQRIFLKENFGKLCGISFTDASFVFNFKEKITVLYTKLVIQGLVKEE